MRTTKTESPTGVVLSVLFVGAFVMGCAEMLVVGMIDLIAADLQVSVPTAGWLVTANALGLAIGGPLLALATTSFDRRSLALFAAAAFVAVNLTPVLGAGFGTFLVVRVLGGALQGLFIVAAFGIATAIVPPERTGRAMGVVISGFATASAFGLPLGTLLGQAVGWRWSFAVMVALGLATLVVAAAVIPVVPAPSERRAAGQLRYALAPRVLAVLGIGLVMFVGIQSVLTYLVPYLRQVTGVPAGMVSAFLFAYGIATAISSYFGGRLADWDAARTMVIGTIGVAACLLALRAFGSHPAAAALCVIGIGLFGMGIAPSMQHRVAHLAGPGAAVASSLPSSGVNLGIAAGAAAGGLTINLAGISEIAVTGTVIAALAIVVAWSSRHLRPREATPGGTPQRKEASWQA